MVIALLPVSDGEWHLSGGDLKGHLVCPKHTREFFDPCPFVRSELLFERGEESFVGGLDLAIGLRVS